MRRISVVFRIAAIVPLLFVAAAAHAQTAPSPQPLVVETIPTGWVLAPDFKATEVDNQFGQLAGAYAGRVTDDTVLVGGAAYWLVNGSDDFKLAYGGLLLGWNADRTGRLRSARAASSASALRRSAGTSTGSRAADVNR